MLGNLRPKIPFWKMSKRALSSKVCSSASIFIIFNLIIFHLLKLPNITNFIHIRPQLKISSKSKLKYSFQETIIYTQSVSILTDFTQGDKELLLDSQFFHSKPVEPHAAVKHPNRILFGDLALGVLLDKSLQVISS